MVNVSHIEKGNYVNGIGRRFVIWVQGCNFHCPGCGNPDTWSFETKKLFSAQHLFNMICEEPHINGVTFSGGEPFLQAGDLFLLAKEIKEKTDLTLHIFTGFELDELITDEQRKLLNLTDTLVYGRFDSSKPNNNQKVWHNPQSRDFWDFNNTDVEIDVDDNGDINISGFPTLDLISDMEDIQNERI